MTIFPIDPHCKNRHVMTLPKAGDFYDGIYGEILNRCRIWMKFRPRVCLKHSTDRGEFELDWSRCYKNIAENSFALGHETDSSLPLVGVGLVVVGFGRPLEQLTLHKSSLQQRVHNGWYRLRIWLCIADRLPTTMARPWLDPSWLWHTLGHTHKSFGRCKCI